MMKRLKCNNQALALVDGFAHIMVIAGRWHEIDCAIAHAPWTTEPTEDIRHVEAAEVKRVHVA